MPPKDFIAARENKTEQVLIDGQPYYPHLMVRANDLASIRQVVATLFGVVNGESANWPVSVVSGGITNQLYRVDRTNQSILVRIFGAEGMIDRDVETATFAALASRGLSPKYYGRFANGRLEEWLDGMEPLTCRTMADHALSIARQLARLHSQFTVPDSLKEFHDDQNPNMWTQLSDWMDQASKATLDAKDTEELRLAHIPAELNWLREHVVPKDAPVAFCHNDLLAANIMLHSSAAAETTNVIRLIDFEYGGINYKAFDIANHFNEYAGGTEDGNTNYDWFPGKQQQLAFLRAYLGETPSESEVQKWYDQVQPFVLANHLYWGLWAVNQAATEGCQDFDYLLFAQNRIGRYFECKQQDFLSDE